MDQPWREGDAVANPVRPEWGIGRIIGIELYPGQTARRIRINFAGIGVKTMVIPPARLVRPGQAPADDEQRLKEKLDADRARVDALTALPETLYDRLASLGERVAALAALYRFAPDARGIFDWAVAQLGEKDPLATFSADQLEQHFAAFARRRDRMMQQLHHQAHADGREETLESLLDHLASPEIRRRIQAIMTDNNSDQKRGHSTF